MTNAVNVATTALKTIASAPEAAQSSPHIAQSVEATSDWLASFTALVDKADGYVWGVPLIAAILVTGLVLTCVLRLSHIFNLRFFYRSFFFLYRGLRRLFFLRLLCNSLFFFG